MLVLTRKVGESVRINDDITVTICEIKGNRVRLGIAAPQHVRILRSEVPPQTQAATPTVPKRPLVPPLAPFFSTTTFATA